MQVNNSNRLATVTAGASVEQTDAAVWQITFTPQSVASRVSVIMSMNVRAEDDGSTEEEVRYTYSLFEDTDAFNRISAATSTDRSRWAMRLASRFGTISLQNTGATSRLRPTR